MTLLEWLAYFGIPALITGAVVLAVKIIFAHINAVKRGVQALLQVQMVNYYNEWSKRGYAPIHIRNIFQNCWVQYHALGANGVMNDIHNKFLALPIEPPEKEESVADEVK